MEWTQTHSHKNAYVLIWHVQQNAATMPVSQWSYLLCSTHLRLKLLSHTNFCYLKAFCSKQMLINISWMRQKRNFLLYSSHITIFHFDSYNSTFRQYYLLLSSSSNITVITSWLLPLCVHSLFSHSNKYYFFLHFFFLWYIINTWGKKKKKSTKW